MEESYLPFFFFFFFFFRKNSKKTYCYPFLHFFLLISTLVQLMWTIFVLLLAFCCVLQAFQPPRISRYLDWRRTQHRSLSSSTDDHHVDPYDSFSTFDKLLFARFSASVATEMGTKSSPRNYGQLMDLINEMTTTRPTSAVHDQGKNMLVRLFPKWLLVQYQWMFAAPFPRFSAWMNAYVTHWTTNWLMGNSTVRLNVSSFLVPHLNAFFLPRVPYFIVVRVMNNPDLRLGIVRWYHGPTTRTVGRKMSVFRIQCLCPNMFACLQSAYPTILSRGNGIAGNITTQHDGFKVCFSSHSSLQYFLSNQNRHCCCRSG